MKLQLIQGEFNAKDALELITQMIHIKIKYHENKIIPESTEEEIKSRESKIKMLQKELYELRNNLQYKSSNLWLNAVINVEA
jgi:hypothetical protein